MHESRLSKIVLNSVLKHKVRFAVTVASIAASLVLAVLPPLVLADVVNALADGKGVSLSAAVEYFGILAASGLCNALREGMIVAMGEGLSHDLRTAMMQKLHRLPASYFRDHEAGETASIQVNDVDAIEDLFSSGIVSMISDLGTLAAILIVVYTKSRGLFVILLIALPILSLFTAHVQKRMLASHAENRSAIAKASGILPETLRIMRSLHVYHAERFAEKKYDETVQNSFRAIEKTNYYDAVYSPVILSVSALIIGIMMSLSGMSGAFRSWFGMSVGTAVALISYVNQVFSPLSSIGMEIQTVQGAAAGWKRVQQFLLEKEKKNCDAEEADDKCENAVSVHNVTFSYDGIHPVLQDFSMDVRRGELVTLRGPTGAGKSTLFQILLGLYEPSSGQVRINGVQPQQLTDEKRAHVICCVQQKVSAVPGSVREQISLKDPMISDEDVWNALDEVGLKETVSALAQGIDTPCSDASFSHGQMQLLMIARAIAFNPCILLLDEITAGLDSETEKEVLTALHKASSNRTVISISHRFSKVMEGRVVELNRISA